uniref:Uncharacterized protein n=1 Tax=Alexandrium monilatum TaxID=311494 RepID=A0A7S4PV52_9DINO
MTSLMMASQKRPAPALHTPIGIKPIVSAMPSEEACPYSVRDCTLRWHLTARIEDRTMSAQHAVGPAHLDGAAGHCDREQASAGELDSDRQGASANGL